MRRMSISSWRNSRARHDPVIPMRRIRWRVSRLRGHGGSDAQSLFPWTGSAGRHSSISGGYGRNDGTSVKFFRQTVNLFYFNRLQSDG